MKSPEGRRSTGVAADGADRLVELDLLRTIAAFLMILNHATVALYVERLGLPTVENVAFFVGGFAPALFFFATGAAIGLQTGAPSGSATALRVGLLVLADQFFFVPSGRVPGLDFFGLIAIATALVSALASLRPARALAVAASIVAGLLVVRFAFGHTLASRLSPDSWLHWLVGMKGIPGVAYPASPWLVYPLLGFIVVRMASLRRQFESLSSLVALATVATLVALGLQEAGRPLFRWGTVSVSWFILSIGVLTLSWVLARLVSIHGRHHVSWLALLGVSAFAVVPVHYGLIALGREGWVLPTYLLTIGATVAASFALARVYASAVARIRTSGSVVLTAVALLSAACLAILAFAPTSPLGVAVIVCCAQLSIGVAIAVVRPSAAAAFRNRPTTSRDA